MKTKIVIYTLILAFVFASFIGCTLGPVEIEEIVVCKNVDDTGKPIEPMDTFPSGTQIVHVSIKINNITPEDQITTKWNYLETGEEIDTVDFTTEESGSGYTSFNLATDLGFPSGRYNIVVYLNNELIETVEYSVE
ncbi:hypothetical protein ES708_14899 [subsurface metagenome]